MLNKMSYIAILEYFFVLLSLPWKESLLVITRDPQEIIQGQGLLLTLRLFSVVFVLSSHGKVATEGRYEERPRRNAVHFAAQHRLLSLGSVAE